MNDDPFTLELPNIVASKEYFSVTRLLASTMMIRPYFTLGEWFLNVSDNDLELLQETAQKQVDLDEEHGDGIVSHEEFENVMLIAMMLMYAEGLDITEEAVYQNVNTFIVMLTMEGMRRKKLIDIDYEHLSFGDEFKNVTVVTKRPELDDYINGLEDD